MADGVKCGLELLVTINVKRLCKAFTKSTKELAVQGDWSSFINKKKKKQAFLWCKRETKRWQPSEVQDVFKKPRGPSSSLSPYFWCFLQGVKPLCSQPFCAAQKLQIMMGHKYVCRLTDVQPSNCDGEEKSLKCDARLLGTLAHSTQTCDTSEGLSLATAVLMCFRYSRRLVLNVSPTPPTHLPCIDLIAFVVAFVVPQFLPPCLYQLGLKQTWLWRINANVQLH